MRFFYKDPLAAAWMAKHFEMKIETPHGLTDSKAIAAFAVYFDEQKMYIHPDSLLALSKISATKMTAMKELGLWPQEEQDY